MSKSRLISWESHLIVRASEGDQEAFEMLCATYRPALVSLAHRMLRHPDDANDAVQDTLVKAFRAIRDFDPERPLKPWLCRICANCCVDAVRARRRSGEGLDQHEFMLQDAVGVDDRAEGSIQQGQILEAIGRLPERYQRIIMMRHFRHMDVNEIAIALDKPEGTIKSWLFRARALLKKDLAPAMG
jgi:RNA polymerase sigma-70 factor (ECF subfamily)